MGKFIDMTGWKMWEHGVPDSKLIVVGRADDKVYSNGRRVIRWHCKCKCGSSLDVVVTTRDLNIGHTKSCGCIYRQSIKESCVTHGETNTRLYHIWCGMKARCMNLNSPKYKSYGGRGITVCKEWVNSYENFRDWSLSHGYKENLTIDRIDVNDGYRPDNCRWADNFTQANNRQDSFRIEYKGEIRTVHEWSGIVGISAGTIRRRIKNLNWSVEDAMTKPIQFHSKQNTKKKN